MPVFTCAHCKARTTHDNHGPGISSERDGRFHSLFLCVECKGVAWGSWSTTTDLRMEAPLPREGAAPELPDNVRISFAEAIGALNGGLWRSAVIMSRSAIQAAVRGHGATGTTLAAEIKDLAVRNVVPQPIADWANEIRTAGNPVAHPEDEVISEHDAEEIIALADSLFDYLYVIPREVERRRTRLAETDTVTTADGPTPPAPQPFVRLGPGTARLS
jgi:hypothetical protein